MSLIVNVKKLNEDAKLPFYATSKSTGADLFSTEDLEIPSKCHVLVGTGISVQPARIFDIQIRPRSGLAAKHGITVLNSPATIDSDFTGEVKVILINHGNETFKINVGDRIAQMVALGYRTYPSGRGEISVNRAIFVEVKKLTITDRGTGGFGSTGQ